MRTKSKAISVNPKIRPIKKTTISDEIVEQIMGLIESGELQPGQRLPSERDLCVQFGTGRSSLREALRCLSIVGVLQSRVGDGTTVAVNSGKFLGKIFQWRLITEQQNIENLMQVRIALEGLTAANVAINGTAEDLRSLKLLLEQMKASLNDRTKFSALDLEFHIALAKASGNSLTMDLISMIRGQLARALNRVLVLPNARPLSLDEHLRIVGRIRDRDAEGARKAMDIHLNAALERYRKRIAIDKTSNESSATPKAAAGKATRPKKKRSAKQRAA
jgi:GntR family transcriptional repressor for pyruvate dehydrogenase complex